MFGSKTSSRARLASKDAFRPVPMAVKSTAQELPTHRSGACHVGQESQPSAFELHVSFSALHFHQGWAVPAHDASVTLPLNMDCPFHAAILQCRPPRTPLQETAEHRLLSTMPPVGLNHQIRTGTSASCGCTCALFVRPDLQRFALEVEATTQHSSPVVRNVAGQP
jgi:hypothetical protein